MIFRSLALAALPLALSTAVPAPLSAQEAPIDHSTSQAAASGWIAGDWDLQDSEFQPEAGWHFGKLDNGMRYIIRPNNRPENTALVRMFIAAGSIDERPEERGFAHYVEHMAFNGSTNVPEGEMIKLLEREGLAFGVDTNASTGFEQTQYKLDLPRADADLLDTALMLMRETVSELTIAEEAVERERGVILSERRVRNSYSFKNLIDALEFTFPDARLPKRIPIGTLETLQGATAEGLRRFWEREYVPADTVILVVGDFEPGLVEAKIRERFADWQPAISPDQPDAGPVDNDDAGRTHIYLDPALTETITLTRTGPYVDRPDTLATRQQNLLRSIGRQIIGRRLQRLIRSENPPFRGVNIAVNDFFETARTTELSVSTEEAGWQRGLDVAVDEYRRALIYGFTEAEVAEQLSNMRTGYENAAANAATRSNASYAGRAQSIVRGRSVPDGPAERLARFNRFVPEITPAAILQELRGSVVDLDEPLIRFSGKVAPAGGKAALRQAVEAAFAREVSPPEDTGSAEFAYTDFGQPGSVVSDTMREDLGIRMIRFDNNVRLNLKPTDLEDDRIRIRVAIDGGSMLRTRDNPLAVELTGLIASGGLGKHSRDELQTILAGRSVSGGLSTGSETFNSSVTTTPRDFELQLQLLTAFVTDPGYRPEGLGPWRKGLDDFFARLGRTPGSAYGEASRAILSDGDPRFSRQPVEAYRALDFGNLKATISDRLENGAIEIAIVGDFDPDEAIALVGRTFGALPKREAEFRAYDDDRRIRTFTDDHGIKTVTHEGEADQALFRMVWLTTDDEDFETTSRLSLLARVARLMLTEKLREELGQTYTPSVSSNQSGTYTGYGTFSMGAPVDAGQLDAVKAAVLEVITRLRDTPPDADLIQRAKQPIIESLDNRLKSNSGWMSLVDRAQSKPEDILRFQTAKARYEAMEGEELQALANKYLDPEDAVEFRVVPSDNVLTANPEPVSDR